ncbi:pancreatic secretory granule membrane major glycoprotein GP2 isoform X1 [Erpetoichthys calabaricus]|uniref:pancreatic secretory granule membrane major glycoprotein GP2 isoform X1 n=1 Tax=Erpetoichthys calabaricus TaxID=27687 RepID=UPI0022342357|nr:pancreatic secretory granule membrane major glycoprotein GP2 isoform X1 [Erpetoichthys calabaricus]
MASVLFLLTLLSQLIGIKVQEMSEINETVICSKDLMIVDIPSAFFLNKTPPVYVWDLHLNDPSCRGFENDSSYIFSIRTNLTDCGTITASDDKYITFTNSIHNNNSDFITRTYINITFACRYPVNYIVQQPNGENKISVDIRTITLNTENGSFSVSMMLYKDENFTDKWTTVPFLTLEDHIYVKVFMVPAHLIVRLDSCWATPTQDPYSQNRYTFIKDNCPEVSKTQILHVLKNGESPEAKFQIQMFKFVGNTYKDVFLHCSVQICHNTVEVCRPNCSEEWKPRTRRDITQSHTVSYGPIRRATSEENADQNTGLLPLVECFVLGSLFLIVMLVMGVFGRLWLRSRGHYPAMQAQLTLSNIHHLSEVAS